MVLARILVLVATFAGGLALIRYAEPIVRSVGHMDWAERTFGVGGSYTVWKIAGGLVMILGFLYAIGRLDIAPGAAIQQFGPSSIQ